MYSIIIFNAKSILSEYLNFPNRLNNLLSGYSLFFEVIISSYLKSILLQLIVLTKSEQKFNVSKSSKLPNESKKSNLSYLCVSIEFQTWLTPDLIKSKVSWLWKTFNNRFMSSINLPFEYEYILITRFSTLISFFIITLKYIE